MSKSNKFQERRRRYFDAGIIERETGMRKLSSRIYENGAIPHDIKCQLQDSSTHYRFVGVRTDKHWSIADIPAVWPQIEKLHAAHSELETARDAGNETKMKRGNIKHHRRVVEVIAEFIDHLAMRPVKQT